MQSSETDFFNNRTTTLPIKYYKDLKLSEEDGNNVISYSINSDGLKQICREYHEFHVYDHRRQ